MSEARKLPPVPEHEPTVLEIAPAAELPVLPGEKAASTAAPKTNHSVAAERVGRATNVLLILFMVGLAAFILGIAVASAVITGALDLNTGWVKDLLNAIKDLAGSRAG